ncbi:hypothetical protein [Ruegeria lacuscaerulensis]|uniref:hypothetical protein n=1 Tax=Ruegeria lacuscaerulensis TaxID=55218 RepID=UPI0014815364|nr:hypothetical protein [Ruegeria lacuscaerulensis]
MKTLTLSTLLALSVVTFDTVAPSIAQAQSVSQSQSQLETTFKQLPERDRITIQSQLLDFGLYSSTLDGLWGRNTENALRQAAMMMEQNMGTDLALHSPQQARAYLNQFIDGSASAFMWGGGGECDGCEEPDLQPATASTTDAGNAENLQRAIFAACVKNARLLNHYMSTDPVGSNAFNNKASTSVNWAEIGLSVKRLGVHHVNNRWQAVDGTTLMEACKEQEQWADLFDSEIQYLGKHILLRDLAYRDTETGQLSDDLALHEKHSVAVYPLTGKETERLNSNQDDYDIMAASFHLIESTACRGSRNLSNVSEQRSAPGSKARVVGVNKSTKAITACEEVSDVFVGGQPFDLSKQNRCFVKFHIAPNTTNVAEEPIDDDALRAFLDMGGYALHSRPFGLHLLDVLSHSDFQNWQHRGAWFLEGKGDIRDVAKVLGSATDAFEDTIEWEKAQQQLDVTAYTFVTQPALGRDQSAIAKHPLCQTALKETRNKIASQRLSQ